MGLLRRKKKVEVKIVEARPSLPPAGTPQVPPVRLEDKVAVPLGSTMLKRRRR